MTQHREPGRTAYEARFEGETQGPRGTIDAWQDLPESARVVWRRVEEVCRGGLSFPRELTPALSEVLGLMNFRTCPMAHAFRDAGRAEIPRKVENEQAFILHWLVTLVLEHGGDWWKHADETLKVVIDEAKARAEAADA